jgi:hypothetical protein
VTAGAAINYTIKREAAPPAVQPATDPVVRRQSLGQRMPDVTFSLNGATADPYGGAVATPTPVSRVVFDARGLPNLSGAYFVASTDSKYSHAVSVTGAGRVRLWSKVDGTWR